MSDWIHIQYKATNPLWGMRSMPGEFGKWRGSTEPKELTPEIFARLCTDFQKRVGIPNDVWELLLQDNRVTHKSDVSLGVDSYITISAGGTIESGEYQGMTVREMLNGLKVRLALEAWQK